jgi:hypothetical protein
MDRRNIEEAIRNFRCAVKFKRKINFEPYVSSQQLHMALGILPVYEFIRQYTFMRVRSNGASPPFASF